MARLRHVFCALGALFLFAFFLLLPQSASAATFGEYAETVKGTPTSGCADTTIFAMTGGNTSGDQYGVGCFISSGDNFYVEDTRADGASVAVLWQTSSGRSGIARDKLGSDAGSTIDYRDFPETARVWLKMGRCFATSTNDCRDYGDYTNIRYTNVWTCVYANGDTCRSQP